MNWPTFEADGVRLINGDCLDVLASLPDASVDAVITDPPYPEINRPYGRMTESDWHVMMRGVVEQCRRILKSTGSAMFILQPNSERVGRMRPWLWEFMAWTTREWGMVQDAWWWNITAVTEAHSIKGQLMRCSAKALVWLGPHDCYRDQNSCLWDESLSNAALRLSARCERRYKPSGHGTNDKRATEKALERGGVTPFNVLPIPNSNSTNSAGSHGHGAGTPEPLADWWTRYICPPDGTVLDPFVGSGTMALAANKRGRRCIGIERDPTYFETAIKRVKSAQLPLLASDPV